MPRIAGVSTPAYRLHKPRGLAKVTICGRDHYLGPHGSKASRDEYARLIAQWERDGRPTRTEPAAKRAKPGKNKPVHSRTRPAVKPAKTTPRRMPKKGWDYADLDRRQQAAIRKQRRMFVPLLEDLIAECQKSSVVRSDGKIMALAGKLRQILQSLD